MDSLFVWGESIKEMTGSFWVLWSCVCPRDPEALTSVDSRVYGCRAQLDVDISAEEWSPEIWELSEY